MSTQEWRALPEFPGYQITVEGDVRNRQTRKPLRESQNAETGAWFYTLQRPDGTSTCRNFWGLVLSAFPEMQTPPEWTPVPGFPRYQMNRGGAVRSRKSQHVMKVHYDGKGEFYNLYRDGVTYRVYLPELTTREEVAA